jgi:membrane associated rhomboid family serine protease
VYGVLLAFGMLFPNTPLFIIPIPFPIKAKWLVIGFGALELFLGVTQMGGNIAHFAHLGGMIFGFILIKYWNRFTRNFY